MGEGGAGDAEEAADKEVKEADASGPILGILRRKIRAAARLERKEMRNLLLAFREALKKTHGIREHAHT